MTTLRFDGRVVVVTGAGRGVGRACAEAFAARGAAVVVNDTGGDTSGFGNDRSVADGVVDALRRDGADAVASADDAVTRDGAAAIVGVALERWGRIDVIVANAGVSWAVPLLEVTDDDVERAAAVNSLAPLHLVQAAWEPMRAQGGGRIVTVSSAGVFGIPHRTHYVMSKAAVLGLTASIGLEGRAAGIVANCVLPWANTRLAGEDPDPFVVANLGPEHVAAGIVWLAHPTCPARSEAFALEGGRMARVALASAEGVVLAEPTPEGFAARSDDVRDTRSLVPVSSTGRYVHDRVRPVLGDRTSAGGEVSPAGDS